MVFNQVPHVDTISTEINDDVLNRGFAYLISIETNPESRNHQGFVNHGTIAKACAIFTSREYYVPFYLGVFSVTIYTVFLHCLLLKKDWRRYLTRVFTYTELLWIVLCIVSYSFRLVSDQALPCYSSFITQNPFESANTTDDIIRTAFVDRYELHITASHWEIARELLGLALFIHLFNSLKFLANFSSLGTLIRTLQAAGPELASFSLSFSIVFMAFVVMFYTIFSLQVKEFSTILRSVSTLWLGIIGELSITDQMWARKEWAVPLVVLFTFVSVFVLLTLIIAIISNAHDRMKTASRSADSLLREKQLVMFVIDRLKSYKRKNPVADDVTSRLDVYRDAQEDRNEGEDAANKPQPVYQQVQSWWQKSRQEGPGADSVPATSQ